MARRQPWRRRAPLGALLLLLAGAAADVINIDLRPGEERCFYEDLVKDVVTSMDVFVGSGESLDTHLLIEGPFQLDAHGLPKLDKGADVIVDRTVTQKDVRQRRDDAKARLDDAFSTTFKSDGGTYRLCVRNTVGTRSTKRLQVDIHVGDEEVGESVFQPRGELQDVLDTPGTEMKMEGIRYTLTEMEDLMSRLIRKQQRERHRLSVHAALNAISRTRMLRGSALETLIYLGFTAFQIMFIRFWFSGRNTTTKKQNPASWA